MLEIVISQKQNPNVFFHGYILFRPQLMMRDTKYSLVKTSNHVVNFFMFAKLAKNYKGYNLKYMYFFSLFFKWDAGMFLGILSYPAGLQH